MTRPWQEKLASGSTADPYVERLELDVEDGYLTTTAVLSDGRRVQWMEQPGLAGRVDPLELARHLQAVTPPPRAADRQVG